MTVPQYLVRHVMPVASALLPAMECKINGVTERLPRPMTPRHTPAEWSRDHMADQKSTPRRRVVRSHGLAGRGRMHPLYRLLKSMLARCRYPKATHYAFYGGRGISVCDEWANDPLSFVAWAEANGWRRGLEIDRIDPDGNYEPSNCRFVTHRENSQTTRRIRTTAEQAEHARRLLDSGQSIKSAASAAGVTYMVAWHIKNSPGVWK